MYIFQEQYGFIGNYLNKIQIFQYPTEKKSLFFGPSYYEAGHSGNDDHYLSEYKFCQDRSDPDLIAVIEEFKERTNSWASEIAIVEVPDDVKWHIHEYDGLEHVAENHRTWYGD